MINKILQDQERTKAIEEAAEQANHDEESIDNGVEESKSGE
jgi:hypothetical protein